jgi:hypothetical protein
VTVVRLGPLQSLSTACGVGITNPHNPANANLSDHRARAGTLARTGPCVSGRLMFYVDLVFVDLLASGGAGSQETGGTPSAGGAMAGLVYSLTGPFSWSLVKTGPKYDCTPPVTFDIRTPL